MTTQILIWWLVAQAFGLAGLPLAGFVFRALPDRGYAFAKALGLLLAGYLAWLIAMLGLAPFGVGLIVASALAVGLVGWLVNRRPTTGDRRSTTGDLAPQAPSLTAHFSTLAEWLRARWRMVLGYELLFALALVFLALLRSYNPTPWGTERPMDYALFNAIRRSAAFPPHDPWLAGYSINYYYFGYMLMAIVALLSGLPPSVGFNLSLALIFALTALGAAGVVNNLIGLTEDRGTRTEDEGSQSQNPSFVTRLSSFAGRAAAIGLTVVLLLFAANQGGALEVVTGTEMATALKGPQLAQAISNGLGPRQPLYLDPPYRDEGWGFGNTSVITPTNMLENFNWWWPSRSVWDDYRDPENPGAQPIRRYTITEFPFFSFWLGDMHPHVMALPFCLLALGLALQAAARPAAPAFAMGRRGWLELALTGIVLGSLYAINSWDFPTYLLLFLGALLILHVRIAGDQGSGLRGQAPPTPDPRPLISGVWWRHYAGQAVMVALASLVMLAPFYLTFRSLVGGKEPLIGLPILATITRTLGFVTSSRTALFSFLLIFGLFLAPLLVYVLAQGRCAQDREPSRQAGSGGDPLLVSRSAFLPAWLRALPWAALAALLLGLLIGFPLLALLPLAIYGAALALWRASRPATALALWAFALICLVCFGTEIVYIRDGFEGASSRMNTIFKFYYQAWLIWAVLAGYALWWLVARPTTKDEGRMLAGARAIRWSSIVFRLSSFVVIPVFVLLLAGALLYPWLTAGKTFREGERAGLVGQTPRESTPDGAAAIEWLRANAPGSAVVLEAVGGSYSPEGFGGVSASTGLATVLGWPGHEDQWRGGDPAARAQIGPRQEDVKTIYGTPNADEARALLQKYKVDYIYVGQLEQQNFAPEGLAKLAQLGEPVFQQGQVTIYQVTKR